jgi:hypothetical protein
MRSNKQHVDWERKKQTPIVTCSIFQCATSQWIGLREKL